MEPFPSFEQTSFEASSTPEPHKKRSTPAAMDQTSPSQASPATKQRIHDKVKTTLSTGYTVDQQEEVTKLILESIGEQKDQLQERRKVTDETLAYVEALKECVARLSKFQTDMKALHEEAEASLQQVLAPVKTYLSTAGAHPHHSPPFPSPPKVPEVGGEALMTILNAAAPPASEPAGPQPSDGNQTGVMPTRSLSTANTLSVIREELHDLPESQQHSAFAHELPEQQQQYSLPLPLNSITRPISRTFEHNASPSKSNPNNHQSQHQHQQQIGLDLISDSDLFDPADLAFPHHTASDLSKDVKLARDMARVPSPADIITLIRDRGTAEGASSAVVEELFWSKGPYHDMVASLDEFWKRAEEVAVRDGEMGWYKLKMAVKTRETKTSDAHPNVKL